MSEVSLHTPDNDAADWRQLADQVFPADALHTTRQRSFLFQWSKVTEASPKGQIAQR